MKQNKNSSVKRISCFVLSAFVLLFSISIPVFAYTDISTNGVDFSDQPIPSVSAYTKDALASGLNIYTSGNPYYLGTTGDDDIYAFTSGSSLFVVSETLNATFGYSAYGWSWNTQQVSITYTNQFQTYGLYWSQINLSNPFSADMSSFSCPRFSGMADGFAAVRDWIDTAPSPVTPHSLVTTLPAGNAIIIDVSGNSAESLSLSSTSALRHKDNWSDGNQMMGYFSSAPSSLSSPFEGTHSITWRGVGSPNLFGGFNTWSTTAPLLPTGNFLVIVNPAYPNDNPDSITSNQASNGAITISCGYCKSVQIVPLSSSWSDGSIVSTSGNLRLDGEYDPTTDSWSYVNSSTGDPQNPVSGGLTDVDAEHITINDWLQNISHQIGSFFAGAIGAVSTLVSAGSDFIHSLSGLYAWLPAPVYSVLVSALILVITIGVIKVFI